MTPLCPVCVATPGVYALAAGSAGTGEVSSKVNTPPTTTLLHANGSTSACTEQLARFFPDAEPVQVRAELRPLRSGAGQIRESVVVEFVSTERAIFSSRLPLEFDDRVRMSDAEGNVEAVEEAPGATEVSEPTDPESEGAGT